MLATGAFRTQAAEPVVPLAAPAAPADRFHASKNFALVAETAGMGRHALAATSDNGLLLGGSFTMIDGRKHSNLTKVKADGTWDHAFNSSTQFDAAIGVITLQADGKILVGGWFHTVDDKSYNGIARLNADGSLDSSFAVGTGFSSDALSLSSKFLFSSGEPEVIVVQADGKILVGGQFSQFNGTPCQRIARLNANGSLDTAFNQTANLGGEVRAITLQADGKILVGGFFSERIAGTPSKDVLKRFNADGSLDTSFNFDPGASDGNIVEAIAVLADGKILVGGKLMGFFDEATGRGAQNLVRVNADGSYDRGFVNAYANAHGHGGWNTIRSFGCMIPDPDGRILLSGEDSIFWVNPDGSTGDKVTRLEPTSSPVIIRQADGQIVYTSYNKELTRIDNTGNSVTLAFGETRCLTWAKTTPISGDRILVSGGAIKWLNGKPAKNLTCMKTDGTIDPTFGANTVFTPDNPSIKGIVVQPDGRIVVAGYFSSVNGLANRQLARLNTNGSLDTSFSCGTGLGAYFLPTLPEYPFEGVLASVTCLSNGKIVVSGWFDSFNGVPKKGLVRLNADGSVDNSCDPGTGFVFVQPSNGMVVPGHVTLSTHPGDKIFASGTMSTYNGTPCHGFLVRLNADLTLDTSFNPSASKLSSAADDGGVFAEADVAGTPNTDESEIRATDLLPDGRTLVAGDFTTLQGVSRNRIARLNVDGTLDTTFNPGTGFNKRVTSLLLQSDGRVIVGGYFTTFNGTACNSLVRLNADGTLDTRFVTDDLYCVSSVQSTDRGELLVGDVNKYSLLIPNVGPVITTQPASATVTAGNTVTFTAAASGTPDPTFQWCKGTIVLTGKTGATLSLTNVQASDAGSYTVVATNSVGSATSDAATLTVNTPPVITTQPASATVTVGGTATFTAAASGTPVPTYQWYKGAEALTGKTGATLSLTNVQAADAGSYTVVATNTIGSVTSNAATLTVKAAPQGGSGGGGAPSLLYFAALSVLAFLHRRSRQ